ncbi:MAG: PAS domain-containing protein [Acidobacteria bacterium]|nr:PAS domain-containing protein [Acidobacteriota bacterium]
MKGALVLTLFNAAVLPGVDSSAEYFIAQFHDITDLRAAQAARRASDRHYKSLFDRLPMALCRIHADGTILSMNHALMNVMGISHHREYQDRSVASFYADAEEVTRFFKIMEADAVVRDFETELVRLDGTKLRVRMSAREVREGDKVVFDAAIVDISEQRAAARGLSLRARYSAAVAELGSLALRETETKNFFRSAVRMLAELFDGCSVVILDLPMVSGSCAPDLAQPHLKRDQVRWRQDRSVCSRRRRCRHTCGRRRRAGHSPA